jgi:hypothetical protein
MLPTELMPSHCGLKILADGSKYFGKGGDDKTEGNLSKLTDSPLPDFYNNSSSNKMMGYALTVTSKPDKKKKKKSGWGAGSIGEFVVDVEKPMIDVTDTGAVDASHNIQQTQNSKENDCEKKMKGIFTDDPNNTMFVDVTDGDGYDPVGTADRTPVDKNDDEHNHVYNTGKNIKKATSLYAPAGGKIVGTGVLDDQNWMSVYYASLGGEKNVVLQVWHVENYNSKKQTLRQDGGILLGQMGENGNYTYSSSNKAQGWHVHIQAFRWWGK